jgi:hypothetical protein
MPAPWMEEREEAQASRKGLPRQQKQQEPARWQGLEMRQMQRLRGVTARTAVASLEAMRQRVVQRWRLSVTDCAGATLSSHGVEGKNEREVESVRGKRTR